MDTAPATLADALIAVSNTTDTAPANPLTLPGDGKIEVNFTFPNGNPAAGVPYTLISYTGGTLGDLYVSGSSASLANWTATGVPNGYTATFSDTGGLTGGIDVTFVVPEPASLGLISIGALGLLAAGERRPEIDAVIRHIFRR